MKNYKIIWIAVVVILIAAGGYLIWKNSDKQQSANLSQTNTQTNPSSTSQTNQGQLGSTPNLSDTEDQDDLYAEDEEAPDEKRSEEKPDEGFRQQVITYVNQSLNKLATPPANDKWDIPTLYFVGNSSVYVELYAIDTDLAGAKMLYKAEKDTSGIKLNEVARYKEGEEDWILSSGQDNLDNYVMEEYDYNDKTQKWEKTDEFTEESFIEDIEDLDTAGDNSPATGRIVE